jgi:hypothetical protein
MMLWARARLGRGIVTRRGVALFSVWLSLVIASLSLRRRSASLPEMES